MTDQLTALVTGVGGPLGVSIFKGLRCSALHPRIVGTDADPLSVGLFRADAGYVLPRVDRGPEYVHGLEEVCLREGVRLVCFGSEPEMEYMAQHASEFERETGARLVVNEPRFLSPLTDKLNMVRMLREKDLPVPDTIPADDAESVRAFLARHTFPVVLKPRHGSGSKNLFVLRGPEELTFFSRYVREPVLQEYLFPDDEEYTVGVYKSPRTGYVGQIALKRQLGAGGTYKAEVVFDREIESICRRLVQSFDIWGPVNVQLRKTAAGVRIFELNVRFSGSAVMRAQFGFNEADLCIRDLVLEEAIPPPEIRAGIALRYWDEVYLGRDEYALLRQESRTMGPGPHGTKHDSF